MNRDLCRLTLLTCSILLAVSCASESSRKTLLVSGKQQDGIKKNYEQKDLRERFAGGFSYKKQADGTMQVASDRRSSFEGNNFDTGENEGFTKKQFETKGYDKSVADVSRKAFDTKAWKDSRKLDEMTMETPEFIRQAESISKKKWNGSDQSFVTNSVSDNMSKAWDGRKAYETNQNENVIEKRDALAAPPVYSLKEYQVKTVDETRAMMGRTD